MNAFLLIFLLLFSCQKEDTWKTYTIKKGKHSSGVHAKPSYYPMVQFKAVFDNSAKYDIGKDQTDNNKLYGFSEGNHKKQSARIGWMWHNNRLKIYGYTHLENKFYFKYITDVKLFEVNSYSIRAYGSKYIFKVNEVEIEMERGECSGEGYRLYPYFGGNVPAPHDIIIKIKE